MTNIIYYRKIYLLFCSVNIKTTEGWLNVFEKCDFKALIHRRCESFSNAYVATQKLWKNFNMATYKVRLHQGQMQRGLPLLPMQHPKKAHINFQS